MSAKKSVPWIVLGAVLVALGGRYVMAPQRPSPPAASSSAPPPSPVAVVNGLTVISMDPTVQAQNGIQTTALIATRIQTETIAYGTVMDLQPLIDLRSRSIAALADVETAQATANASRQEYERNRILYQDNQNVSLKAFQAAQATYLANQAKVQAATLNAQNLQSAARQQFGEPLGRWATALNSPQFQKLANRQEVLLRITLPLDTDRITPGTLQVEATDQQRLPATRVSPSPQSDPALPGRAWFYQAKASLPAGTKIVAYLPTTSQVTQGLFIPANAIVWYGGQPWAYVQLAPDRFARRPVLQQFPSNGGFFVTEGFRPGERVVTSGAELLLSEEQKPAPNSGTGCKDPECDD